MENFGGVATDGPLSTMTDDEPITDNMADDHHAADEPKNVEDVVLHADVLTADDHHIHHHEVPVPEHELVHHEHHEDDAHHHHHHHHELTDATVDEAVQAAVDSANAEDKDTSALIAEAAAAAVAAATDDIEDVDVTAAALNVKTEDDPELKKEESRKRMRGEDLTKGNKKNQSHEEQLASRRMKDRQRYASMSPDQRHSYNAKRREQYHRQSENSRQKRRERERSRYHSLQMEAAKDRNNRRAKLERERYQRLSADDLESKNRKRRERAAMARAKKEGKIPNSPSPQPMQNHVLELTLKEEAGPTPTACDVETAAAVAAAVEADVSDETVAAAVEAAKEVVEKSAIISL